MYYNRLNAHTFGCLTFVMGVKMTFVTQLGQGDRVAG